MDEPRDRTRWLELIGDRADLGRAIVRLSRLAAAVQAARVHHDARANGLAGLRMDRPVPVAATDGTPASTHREVPR